MATTAVHRTFGNTGSFPFSKKCLRAERIMPKSQQIAKIRQYLSNRGADIDVLDLVDDWVDPTVIYEVNKAEIVSRVGFGTTRKPPSNKDLKEMQCTSLHNQCASNGLETCQIACDECNNPTACKKADRIEKEIKKHGRELTGFERMQTAKAKEAKRKVKKAKYSMGQTVKCREGYELQCGFTGIQKITEVKAYPDYVMYGIKGKAQGFVDEEWIAGIKVKLVLKEKKKLQTDDEIDKEMKLMAKRDEERFKRGDADLPFLKPKFKIGQRVRSSIGTPTEGGFSGFAKITSVDPSSDMVLYGMEHIASGRPVGLSTEESHIKAVPKKKVVKPVLKEKKKKQREPDDEEKKGIKRYNNAIKEGFKLTSSEKQELIYARFGKVFKSDLEYRLTVLRMGTWKDKETQGRAAKNKIVALAHGFFSLAKQFDVIERRGITIKKKPVKPTPAKTIPKKKKKVKTVKPSLQKKALQKKPKPSKTTLHLKILTKNQQALLRKYRFVDVSIQSKIYHVTKQNIKDSKIEWYKKNGKVYLKNKR